MSCLPSSDCEAALLIVILKTSIDAHTPSFVVTKLTIPLVRFTSSMSMCQPVSCCIPGKKGKGHVQCTMSKLPELDVHNVACENVTW